MLLQMTIIQHMALYYKQEQKSKITELINLNLIHQKLQTPSGSVQMVLKKNYF